MRRLARHARRAAASRHLPPEERSRVQEELLGHLEDAAGEYAAIGYSTRKAERLAIRDLGDAGKIRTDFGRAWRRRRVVLFPEAPGEHVASFLIYDAKAILVIILLVLLLRWQVVKAYHIPTKSMEPTLHGEKPGGDKILVNRLYYRFHEPERWQIAVFSREGNDDDLIKRIAGLSGELVDIRDGDLIIDGKISAKPRDVQADLLVPVFRGNRDLEAESEGEEVSGLDAFDVMGDWSESGSTFHAAAPPDGRAEIRYARRIVDTYPGGRPRLEEREVGDVVLYFSVQPDEKVLVVGAELVEGEYRYEARIPVGEGDAALLLVNGEEVARAEGVVATPGEELRVRFANLDGRVTLELDGREVLTHAAPNPTGGTRNDDRPFSGAGLGIRGGKADFRRVEVYRDIYYTRIQGKLPAKVPEGHCFMLGDNSSDSFDSRSWGSVSSDRLIGRPFLVFWPISRIKIVR